MKIQITTGNRLGLTKEILALLAKSEVDVIKVEVETGLMFVETEVIDKLLERNLATKIMQIKDVKWVESISLMPTYEKNLFLNSLLNAINDPVFAINNKGLVIYKNETAQQSFKLENEKKLAIKDIFTEDNWAEKIDAAASGPLPVNIKTIAGSMLVEVRAINQDNQKTIGAVLVLYQPENITTRSHVIEGAEIQGFDGLVFENTTMLEIVNRAKHMSNTPIPLLLYGETGVGKKTTAQAIHHTGKRRNKLFASLNCSRIKSSQIVIELFGLANPVNGKAGLLEIANGGTIYIESIHLMPEDCQNKLLVFIENGIFNRIGGKIDHSSDLKIIASCPTPLKNYVENKQFKKQLFYALDISHLDIIPLRERMDETDSLITYFLQHFLQHFQKHAGKVIKKLSFAALSKIKSYHWPGNITQLKDVLYKAFMVTKGETIEAEHLDIDGHVNIESNLENRSLPQAVAEFEKHFLQHWYQKYSSTRKLAQQLGVSHTTIAHKLNKYEITGAQ